MVPSFHSYMTAKEFSWTWDMDENYHFAVLVLPWQQLQELS